MNSTPAVRKSQDARRAERQRVLLGGRIIFGQDYTYECTIRSLSATGGRVRLPSGAVVPDSFTLVDLPHGLAYDAHIAWRDQDHIGVSFADVHDLGGVVRPDLQRVRAIWIAARMR